MSKHINHILVAEFDIDKGSQLTHQYPEKTGIEETKLAELMLPDGAHLREEDWTFFILNQHVVEDSTSNYSEQQEAYISEGFLKFQPVLSAYCYTYNNGLWEKIIDNEEIFIQLIQDKILLLSKTLRLIGEITPDSLIDFQENINSYSIKLATKSNIYGFKLLNDDDYRLTLNAVRSVLYQKSSLIDSNQVEFPDKLLPVVNNETNALYVLNLVRTKQIPGVRRGARVKAIAITSHHKWLHVFKPLLIMALDNYFEKQDIVILEQLYKSMNSLDISLMPLLSLNEKIILRASDDPMLFNEKFLEMEDFAKSVNKYNKKLLNNSQIKKIDRHFYETNVLYDNGAKNPVKVPIKIPMTMFNGEIGDLSVIQLISTFGNSAYPSKHHPQLDNNIPTNPIIVLINALLTQKRVLFLGHLKPSGEVANFVLAACALGSCGILRGYSERCFPYTNLAGLDDLLKVPGFIAGVTNPAFEEHPQWWDVLFNINSGKVTISPNIERTPPIENKLFINTEKEAISTSFDKEFMNDIMSLIQQKYGEHYIRERFRLYLLRFIEVASEYEKMKYGRTKIYYTSENIKDKYKIGVGPYFTDEISKRREIIYNINRIEGWRKTKSYELYTKDFHKNLLRQSVRCVDLRRQATVLRNETSISPERLNAIMKALSENITTDEQVLEFLTHFLHNQGGLLPIAYSLLHQIESIRINCTKLLVRLDYSAVGSRILSHLNPFFKLAYEKSAQKCEKRWGKNWFIISNDSSTYSKDMVQNQNNTNNEIQNIKSPSIVNGSINNNNSNVNRISGTYISSNPERRRSFNTNIDEVSNNSNGVDSSANPYALSPRITQRKPSSAHSFKMMNDNYSLPVPPRQVESNSVIKVKVKSKSGDDISTKSGKISTTKIISNPESIRSPSIKKGSPRSIQSSLSNHKISLRREKSTGSNPNSSSISSPSPKELPSSKVSRSRSNGNKNVTTTINSNNSISNKSNISHSKSYDRHSSITLSSSGSESDLISNDDLDDEEILKNINKQINVNDSTYGDILEDDLINLYNANSSKEISEDSRNLDYSLDIKKMNISNSVGELYEYDKSMENSKSSLLLEHTDLDDNQLFSNRIKDVPVDNSFKNSANTSNTSITSPTTNDNSANHDKGTGTTSTINKQHKLVFNQRSDSFNHPLGDNEDLNRNILFSNRKDNYSKNIPSDLFSDDGEDIEGYSRAYSTNDKFNTSKGTIDNSYLDGTYSSFISSTTHSPTLSTDSSFSNDDDDNNNNDNRKSNKSIEINQSKDSISNVNNKSNGGISHFGQYGNESTVQSASMDLSNSHLIIDYDAKIEKEKLVIPKVQTAPTSTNPVIQRILQKQQLSIQKFSSLDQK